MSRSTASLSAPFTECIWAPARTVDIGVAFAARVQAFQSAVFALLKRWFGEVRSSLTPESNSPTVSLIEAVAVSSLLHDSDASTS